MQDFFYFQVRNINPIVCYKEADLNEKGFVVNAHLFDSIWHLYN